MMDPYRSEQGLICNEQGRRAKTREAGWNGFDHLEVSEDQRTLQVFFLGRAPDRLEHANVRIEGGRRVRDLRVLDLEFHRADDPTQDDCVIVTLDRPGDFSGYRIRLVEIEADGRPSDRPLAGFDPRYAFLDFDFKVGCPSHLDCGIEEPCPTEERDEPEIDYLARDYHALRKALLDRLSLIMPDWCERHLPDVGITLVEMLAYVGDRLSYYQDAVATEAYLETARQRISVRRHARLVDYAMHEGCNARAWVCIETGSDLELRLRDLAFLTADLSDAKRVLSRSEFDALPETSRDVFEPIERGAPSIELRVAHNRIRFYTWGDEECCLSTGATRATLRDAWIELEPPPIEPGKGPHQNAPDSPEPIASPAPKRDGDDDEHCGENEDAPTERPRSLGLCPGDVLIFEERLGPQTGSAFDADPGHRHAVCLTRVDPGIDPVCNVPIVEIEWAAEDALPFPLCLSVRAPAPDCDLLEDVSVACGNVVLVDHGETCPEDLGTVPVETSEETCGDACETPELVHTPGHFDPRLGRSPLTFCERSEVGCPARDALVQDPRKAVAHLLAHDDEGHPWSARSDLLASSRDDRHLVVEIENDGRAVLRFGDGETGRRPGAGAHFDATYRVGNGPAGNVGADSITRIVLEEGLLSGVELAPRNPLPAVGGTAEESVDQVRLLAPHAFRSVLARAITADDYAAIVERDFEVVQRAAATIRFTGSIHEVLVAVDQRDRIEADPELLEAIRAHLERYRRIGHDLVVETARAVPLDLEIIVCVDPIYLRGHVEAAVRAALGTRSLPDGSRGFFHPDNLSFGEGVFASRILATVQAIDGVESVSVKRLERLYEGPMGELERGVLELGPFEIARLDDDPSFPENGELHLDMRGGR